MQLLLHVAATSIVCVAAIRPAPAQCPLEPFTWASGHVDGGRAIVTDHAFPPRALFLEKGADGWRATEQVGLGDFLLFLDNSVAIAGDRAIAGCPEATYGAFSLAGRAFVFDRVGDHWVPTELVSATNGPEDFYGSSVAIDGDVAVVGAAHVGPDGLGDYLPRAHVFEFDGTAWHEVAQLTHQVGAIDVDGDRIAIGDTSQHPGHVYLYERVAGTWTLAAAATYWVPVGEPRLGSAVALDGDRLVAGAAFGVQTGSGSGFVRVFRHDPGGWWRDEQLILSPAGQIDDRFGNSLSLDGGTLLVGARGVNSWAGAVYRYEHDGTRFVQRQVLGPETGGQNGFGWNVSVQGEDAFLGGSQFSFLYRLGFEETSSYCPTTPNSTGQSGSLSAEGCDSLSGARLTLVASGLPPGVFGQCFFGSTTAQTPFGDGVRCVGTPLHRLPIGAADSAGQLATVVDFASGPASAIAAGRTWKFQVIHRDRTPGGINFTNALAVRITP